MTATAATNTRLARDRSVNTTTSPGHHEQQLRGAKGGATALDSTGSRGPGNRRYSRRRASDDDDEASGIDVHHASGRVSLDGWLWLRASAQTAVLYKRLRGALDAALDARIRGAHHHKGRGGGGGGGGGAGGEDLLKTIRSLLTEQAAPK